MLSPPAPESPRTRLQAGMDGHLVRTCTSFWLFGLINNIFYVIILSAALDLVGPSIPKATVLLASIIPALTTKAIAPYFIHLIPYSVRILLFVALSTCGMLVVALSPPTADPDSVAAKVAGIILANISSGAGEINFLSLTHYYGQYSLAAWGSGTGAAGLVGAGAYALATTTLGFGVRPTLIASAVLPGIMLLSFFVILPRELLSIAALREPLHGRNKSDASAGSDDAGDAMETAGLLDEPGAQTAPSEFSSHAYAPSSRSSTLQKTWNDLRVRLQRARQLIVPYMVPLFLVYLAEYTINQGVAPTLVFPLDETPFAHYRAFYPTYSALYQAGVFISRSSLALFRIRALYLPSLLQIVNLSVLTAQALYFFLPNVWIVFAIVLWEGLLGGLVYVSAYAAVAEEVPVEEREFSLGAVSVADSGGIFIAGLVGMVMERSLCDWQVARGKDWCRRL